MTEYRNIGRIVASFGVKGELILQHELGAQTALPGLEVLFLEDRKDSLLPWFPTDLRAKSGQEIYLQLEGIDTREKAQALIHKAVWLTKEDYEKFAAPSAPGSLLGYQLRDKKQRLGEILEIIEQPHQLLCRIDWKGKEAFIPLHQETLQKIDRGKKEVWVVLPEGLLDIYS